MRKLIVAEKPSVARDIARVLGVKGRAEGYMENEEYVVTWAIGHLVGLAEPDAIDEKYKRWNMYDLPILPEDVPLCALDGTKKQFGVIKKLMHSRDISSIICATDSAREGELIFRYIYRLADCKKPAERLWISSMTDEAIRAGFAALRPDSDYDALYDSAQLRSLADWMIGMNASRAFSIRYNAHLSVGRVQTPTLRMIVDRDREIETFVPRDYYELTADFGDYKGKWIDPETKETRADSKEKLDAVKKAVTGQEARVTEVKREKKRALPPQLYDLTTLQREANSRFGWSADKTLKVAQALYEEKKLLTYPRTDCRYLSDDVRPKLLNALKKLPEPWAGFVSAPEFNGNMHSKRFYDDSKLSDHHAIIPTEKRPGALSPDEAKLYNMVVRRAISAHYPDYEYESAKVVTEAAGHSFLSTGTTPVIQGWHVLGHFDKKEEEKIPNLSAGDLRRVERASVSSHKTKPPARHTDASILGMMENAGKDLEDESLREQMKSSGLGTPATRAAIIERLIQVGYAKRSGKSLVSTDKGRRLIAVAPDQITSPATTGKWEKMLSDVARMTDDASLRAAKRERFMSGIRKFSIFLVDAAKSADPAVHFEREEPKKRVTSRRKPASTAKRSAAK